jgi:hypothetical protein
VDVNRVAPSGSRRPGEALPPTGRQLDVLGTYISEGSHDGAGAILGISARTVQAHLASLRTRLGVHKEAQVVYLLWLAYRDHVASCPEARHEDCEPDIVRVDRAAVRSAQGLSRRTVVLAATRAGARGAPGGATNLIGQHGGARTARRVPAR